MIRIDDAWLCFPGGLDFWSTSPILIEGAENGEEADRRSREIFPCRVSWSNVPFSFQSRDSNLSDGAAHPPEAWEWLDNELFNRFYGRTVAPGEYRGTYTDPDTGQQVVDSSYRYIVAVPKSEVKGLRSVLAGACVIFAQKCIYLTVAGKVEFVEAKRSK